MASPQLNIKHRILDLAINCLTQTEDFSEWIEWINVLHGYVIKDKEINAKNKAFTTKLVNNIINLDEIQYGINHIPLVLRSIIVKYLSPPPMEFIVWHFQDYVNPPIWISPFWYR